MLHPGMQNQPLAPQREWNISQGPLFGATLSIITRSAAFGIAAGFGYLIGEDIAAQILPVIGKSIHLALGNQINNLLYTTNINAFYADALPTALARGLDQLDGVIACNLTDKTCVPVSPGQALLVASIWALVLGGVSTYMFIKPRRKTPGLSHGDMRRVPCGA